MKKQTRKEKKAEEARILAEMKAALEEAERAEKEENGETAEEESACAPKREQPAFQEPIYHCRRCKTVMQKGVCPTCGFKMYVPMDEKKLGKIKLVLTAIGMAVFIALFIYIQIKKG